MTFPTGTIDFALQGLLPGSAPERAGELILMRTAQLDESDLALLGSAPSIIGGLQSVVRCSGSVVRRPSSDLGGVRKGRAEGRAAGGHLPFDLGGLAVAPCRSGVPGVGGEIAVRGRLVYAQPGERGPPKPQRASHWTPSVLGGRQALDEARVVGRVEIGAGMLAQFLVGDGLVAIRSELVTIGGELVANGEHALVFRDGLVREIGRRLIRIRSALIHRGDLRSTRDLREARQTSFLLPAVVLATPFAPDSLLRHGTPIPRRPSGGSRRPVA